MKQRLIYLDNNATTPTDPRVVEAMLPFFTEKFGNAASRHHAYGWEAEEAVEQAREQVAGGIDVTADEIVFTSGATESNNLAIRGVFDLYRRKGNHIVTVKTEHNAVLDVCAAMERQGGEVTYLDVDKRGRVDLGQLEASLRDNTVLVSVMWANNETGVIQPIAKIGEICARHGVLFISDATQAVGKIPVNPVEAGVHLMSFSAHKIYGPKGMGALFVSGSKPRVKVRAQMEGGGHEGGMRSGTLNVPGIVGFGKAIELAGQEMDKETLRLSQWRDQIENGLLHDIDEVQVNGDQEHRMPHVTNLSFRHVKGERLMMAVKDTVAISSGSACTSASLDPSHVLLAMGLSEELAHSSIRISFGRFNQEGDALTAKEVISKAIADLRAENPVWEMFKDGVDLNS